MLRTNAGDGLVLGDPVVYMKPSGQGENLNLSWLP